MPPITSNYIHISLFTSHYTPLFSHVPSINSTYTDIGHGQLQWVFPLNMVIFHSYMSVYQRVNLHLDNGFPMIFPFSYGFPKGFCTQRLFPFPPCFPPSICGLSPCRATESNPLDQKVFWKESMRLARCQRRLVKTDHFYIGLWTMCCLWPCI